MRERCRYCGIHPTDGGPCDACRGGSTPPVPTQAVATTTPPLALTGEEREAVESSLRWWESFALGMGQPFRAAADRTAATLRTLLARTVTVPTTNPPDIADVQRLQQIGMNATAPLSLTDEERLVLGAITDFVEKMTADFIAKKDERAGVIGTRMVEVSRAFLARAGGPTRGQ